MQLSRAGQCLHMKKPREIGAFASFQLSVSTPLPLQASVHLCSGEQEAPESRHRLEAAALDQGVDALDGGTQVNCSLDGRQVRADNLRCILRHLLPPVIPPLLPVMPLLLLPLMAVGPQIRKRKPYCL